MGHKAICVNLFGCPGAGKSTAAAVIFSKLKMAGVNCELVTEYAKDKVWEENNRALENQLYVMAKQYYRIALCAGKVDVIITDSPLFLSAFYNRDPDIDAPLRELVYRVSSKYDNLNYFVRRVCKYDPVGRIHTEAESDMFAGQIRGMLDEFGVKYVEIPGDQSGCDAVFDDVMEKIEGLEASRTKA